MTNIHAPSGDPWIAARIAADSEVSTVGLKADQEGAIADVQSQVIAVRLGETSAKEQFRGRIAEQRQSGERSSESAGADQNIKKKALARRLNTR